MKIIRKCHMVFTKANTSNSVAEYLYSAPLVWQLKKAAASHCSSLPTCCSTSPIPSPEASVTIEYTSPGEECIKYKHWKCTYKYYGRPTHGHPSRLRVREPALRSGGTILLFVLPVVLHTCVKTYGTQKDLRPFLILGFV